MLAPSDPIDAAAVGAPVVRVLLGLGSSLGDRERNLRVALDRLGASGLSIVAVSSILETPHMGLKPGDEIRYPPHLNIVAEADTSLEPDRLLQVAHEVEAAGGRVRTERWGPRTIDIDILDYGGRDIRTDRLTIPHPGIAERAFVAIPLLELQPEYRLPDGTLLRDRES